jgi:hypothetical protein
LKQIVHVNQHHIKKNIKAENDEDILPVLTVKTYKSNNYAYEAILRTKSGEYLGKFVYSPFNPLSCGARVWFESNTDVVDIEVVSEL